MQQAMKNKNELSVSIIIPTYNRPLLLARALQSVQSQEYPYINQIIITDDSETDETFHLVQAWQKEDTRIVYSKNKKYKRGLHGNKNNGLDMVSGIFFGILDDDDELFPHAVSLLMNVHIEKGYRHMFANCIRTDTGTFSGMSYGKDQIVTYADVLTGRFAGEHWALYEYSLLGPLRLPDDAWSGESLLWFQLFRSAPAYYVDQAVRRYYVGSENTVSQKQFQFPGRSFLTYKYYLDLYGDDLWVLSRSQYRKNALLASFFARLNTDWKNTFCYLRLAFKAKPFSLYNYLFAGLVLIPMPRKTRIRLYTFTKKQYLAVSAPSTHEK